MSQNVFIQNVLANPNKSSYKKISGQTHFLFSLDINDEDYEGLSALHVATNLDVVKYLLDNGGQDISKGLHAAAGAGELDTVQYLLENGAEIEARNKGGQTPLMCAAMNGQLEVVTFLVENNAQVQASDEELRTAFDWARIEGHIPVMKYLFEGN